MSYFKFHKLKAKLWMKWSEQVPIERDFNFPIHSLSHQAMLLEQKLDLALHLNGLEECYLFLKVMGKWKKYGLNLLHPRPLNSKDQLKSDGQVNSQYYYMPFNLMDGDKEAIKRDLMLAFGR